MVQAYDHRASDIVSVAQNVFRTGQGSNLSSKDHENPDRLPASRYFVDTADIEWLCPTEWCVSIKDVTSVTNSRSIIAAAIPHVAAGHTLPILVPQKASVKVRRGELEFAYRDFAPLVLANLNCYVLDYLARQKINSNHVAWFMLQQLPFVPSSAYERKFGGKSAAEIVQADVLVLTYTANDMVPFARDMGYSGGPFNWDEEDRTRRRARLDALYFMLYFPSVTKESKVRRSRKCSRPSSIIGFKPAPPCSTATPIFPKERCAGDDMCQVFKSSAGEGSDSARLMLLVSIAAARKHIRIANAYFIPEPTRNSHPDRGARAAA